MLANGRQHRHCPKHRFSLYSKLVAPSTLPTTLYRLEKKVTQSFRTPFSLSLRCFHSEVTSSALVDVLASAPEASLPANTNVAERFSNRRHGGFEPTTTSRSSDDQATRPPKGNVYRSNRHRRSWQRTVIGTSGLVGLISGHIIHNALQRSVSWVPACRRRREAASAQYLDGDIAVVAGFPWEYLSESSISSSRQDFALGQRQMALAWLANGLSQSRHHMQLGDVCRERDRSHPCRRLYPRVQQDEKDRKGKGGLFGFYPKWTSGLKDHSVAPEDQRGLRAQTTAPRQATHRLPWRAPRGR